jgi:hemolysin III
MTQQGPETLREEATEAIRETVNEIKPKLRGWLHLATWPLAFFSFLVLLVLSESVLVRAGAAVFMFSALALFGVSAVYHTGRWSGHARTIWKRADHATIFVLIAGSYTPFSLMLLSTRQAVFLLSVVWGGALLGVLFRIFWLNAPRWMYVPLYLALGWAAVFYFPAFSREAPTSVMVLLIVGGGLYTIGALVYGFRKPDPWPTWYGFHEVFHTLTIAAFIVHYIGVSILAYSR